MAQDIVGGLFGINPQDVMRQQANAEINTATNYANLNPFQQANYGGMLAGQMLGRGVSGLMGAEDPRLVQAKQIQQVKQWIASSGVDINTPEGLAQAAQYAQSIGATEGAMFLGQQALQLRQTSAQVGQAEENLQRGQQYRAAVAALQQDPNATEQDFINLARQFSSPEAGINAAISAEARKEAAAEKQRIKDEATTAQQKAAAELAFGRAGTVLDAAQQAYNMVNSRTAGALGTAMLSIPGSSAVDLEALLKTVTSNLATNELQKIRDASKTGGALGNVSNKDIDLLESAVANLKQKQSPQMLREGLKKVIDLYTKIQRDAGILTGQAPTQPTNTAATPAAPVSAAGWSIVSTK